PTHYDGSKGTTVYYSVDGEPEKSIDITQTEQEITIDIPDDSIDDPKETLTVSLHPGAYILDTDNQSATVTIEDNEPRLNITKNVEFNQNTTQKAIQFDGKDDYVKVPHQEQLNVTEEITVEAYIYKKALVGTTVAFCKKEMLTTNTGF
ncbi:hypothetical protein, partial [Geitlerinema sp. PCC 9228]|uniref:hypothetical protein n=1 Tax=Geitlerinema sp. PCC 9228 TaxID=111611 RepID=UPI00147F9F02